MQTASRPDLRTALERVRDTLDQGQRHDYDRATANLWAAWRYGQIAPATLAKEAQQ